METNRTVALYSDIQVCIPITILCKTYSNVYYLATSTLNNIICEEVEFAVSKMAKEFNLQIEEFTVAPFVAKNKADASYHQWFIEFNEENVDVASIAQNIDQSLQSKNVYYKDLREGNLLSLPKISIIKKGGFKAYQLSKGKLGGQNKVVHLSNDRVLAEDLGDYIVNK